MSEVFAFEGVPATRGEKVHGCTTLDVVRTPLGRVESAETREELCGRETVEAEVGQT